MVLLRRILFVNFMILTVFASVSYWTEEKEKLELTMAEPMKIKQNATEEVKADYIKWVDFGVSKFALSEAYEYDRDTYGTDYHISWIDLLAWVASHTGGVFDNDRTVYQHMDLLKEKISQGEKLEKLVKDLQYFPYYQEAYEAVLGGMVGEYEIEIPVAGEEGKKVWEKKYGLKAFHPIAKGFPYSDYDDFGVSRTYGYRRNHLGHDLMGQTGTPVVAVESGYIEALGWNQYGGWRIGIRSFDKKRYYYYAHLRQGFPWQPELKEGSAVLAGDVIGYMGHTGYSKTEDTNNIDQTHLHFGMQLIFDESQKEGNNEIWIDCYQIVKFLYCNQTEARRNDETKEWRRIYQMKDPNAAAYERKLDFSMYP
ncbi:MAG: M23 family metallopeptidase [Lachnospiraceae bacterium]|nr:M23 family metallopeptidase [Lachnospiraceae bacterium]